MSILSDSDNLLEDFAEDAKEQTEIPRAEKLKELSEMITKMREYEVQIKRVTNILDNLVAKHKEYDSMLIPDLFDELGLRKIALSDGQTVEVKTKYAAAVTEENQEHCFSWLTDNGHESIIKYEVKTDIKKGEKEQKEKLVAFLDELGVSYQDKKFVHWQTLQAFVKEQIESGSDFPKDLFKVFPVRSTKVK